MLSKGKFTENSCVLDDFHNFCDAFITNYNFNADYSSFFQLSLAILKQSPCFLFSNRKKNEIDTYYAYLNF
jgi:hypothetical protein